MTLSDQVFAYSLKHNLFQPGPVVVAVSGGADSLALLHLLLTLRDKLNLTLHAATFDHQIRAEAGAADADFVRQIATTWAIPISAGSADVPTLSREWSMGLEEAARKARYAFLAKTARQIGSDTITTGHNQDDQAETVLMHVIRGSGLAGLRGMLPKSQWRPETTFNNFDPDLSPSPLYGGKGIGGNLTLVRPLLNTPHAEIDAYVRALGIEPRTDLTNADTAYTRNRLRHEIIPALQQINPQVKAALARTAEIARDDYAALIASLPEMNRVPYGLSINRSTFLGLSLAQQRLFIREAAQHLKLSASLSFERIEAAIQAGYPTRIQLGSGIWLQMTGDAISITGLIDEEIGFPIPCPHVDQGFSLSVKGPGAYQLPGSLWQLVVEQIETPVFPLPAQDLLSASLAVESNQRIELRTRRPGDRFKPHGLHGHTQKLQDTWVNMKVRETWRDRIPLLTVNDEIAWFVAPTEHGLRARIGDLFAVKPDEKRTLWRFTFKLVH